MKRWIDTLVEHGELPSRGYRAILEGQSSQDVEYLHQVARAQSERNFDRSVYVRALIEITNRCQNDCFYCGIRASNREVERYSMSHDEILECCRVADALGVRTFVLQGGELNSMSDEWIVDMVSAIRREFPDSAITLSLGERSYSLCQRAFQAGANRYLLRHESYNPEHYAQLHPSAMSRDNRVEALHNLRSIGYQTGTGVMVGSPYQTLDHIIEDIEFIQRFRPEMVGIGPFIPHHATPFAQFPAGSVELTLKLISIFRLMNPRALIPATTSLSTLAPDDGRVRGILAGANVVMPNVSPRSLRGSYTLYDNKASLGMESGEGLQQLSDKLNEFGYKLSFNRGDYDNATI